MRKPSGCIIFLGKYPFQTLYRGFQVCFLPKSKIINNICGILEAYLSNFCKFLYSKKLIFVMNKFKNFINITLCYSKKMFAKLGHSTRFCKRKILSLYKQKTYFFHIKLLITFSSKRSIFTSLVTECKFLKINQILFFQK